MKNLLILLLLCLTASLSYGQDDPTKRINENLHNAGAMGLSERSFSVADSLSLRQSIGSAPVLQAQIDSINARKVDKSAYTLDLKAKTTRAQVSNNLALTAAPVPIALTIYEVVTDANTGTRGFYFIDSTGGIHWIATAKIR